MGCNGATRRHERSFRTIHDSRDSAAGQRVMLTQNTPLPEVLLSLNQAKENSVDRFSKVRTRNRQPIFREMSACYTRFVPLFRRVSLREQLRGERFFARRANGDRA